jgi:hypothetical protein
MLTLGKKLQDLTTTELESYFQTPSSDTNLVDLRLKQAVVLILAITQSVAPRGP